MEQSGITISRAWLPMWSGSLAAAASHSFNVQEGFLYKLIFEGSITDGSIKLQFHNDTGNNYDWSIHYHGRESAGGVHTAGQSLATGQIVLTNFVGAGEFLVNLLMGIGIGASTVAYVSGNSFHHFDVDKFLGHDIVGYYNGAAAITSFQLTASIGNLTIGKYLLVRARG